MFFISMFSKVHNILFYLVLLEMRTNNMTLTDTATKYTSKLAVDVAVVVTYIFIFE